LRESRVYGAGKENQESYIFGIIDILTLYEYMLADVVLEKYWSITSSA
jgi:hypothetical protein